MEKRDPFRLGIADDGHVERVGDVKLRVGSSGDATWSGPGTTIPVFWTAMFGADELCRSGASVRAETALERLTRREPAWKAKSSAKLFRGYDVFRRHVIERASGDVVLDLSGLEAWRAEALASAARQLLDFIDGKCDAPGPLSSGWDECVVWRRGKLVARGHDSSWPDEVPLFASDEAWRLVEPTMGRGPFRNGAWPEREPPADGMGVLPDEVRERRAMVRHAVSALGAALSMSDAAAKSGNLAQLDPARASWAAFLAAAESLAESAAAFGAKFVVLDDGALWRAKIAQARAARTELDELAERIEAAMRRA